jgi:CubicO group peptidase (beta-lactamase class C family)
MRTLPTLLLILASIAGPAQGSLTKRLDSFFFRQDPRNPGFALSIEKNGLIVYRNAAGLADLKTTIPLDSLTDFRMASVTKQFTAMGILLLEKDRKLDLDDPIGRWLPELQRNIGQKVLIRHLLTHSSGIPDYEDLIPAGQTTQVLDADVLKLIAGHDSLYFTPGARFRYSNSGFCLLALIIEKASHESYPEFIRTRIFAPLNMSGSTVYVPSQPILRRAMGYARDSADRILPSDQSVTSATKGDGGVYTSLSDYSKWIRALQQNRLIRLADVMRRLRFSIPGLRDSYYAAGWFETTDYPQLLFHSGSTCGFTNFVIQLPGDELSIVYFSNIAENSAPFQQISRIITESGLANIESVFPLHELTR